MLVMALFPVYELFAQEMQKSKHNNLKLAFEFGANFAEGRLVKPEQIRENHSYGTYNYGYFGDYNHLNTTYFGIKPEYFVFNNRVGIASGLRFTVAKSELASNRDNYLWKLSEDGLYTDYVSIKDIKHRSYLLGVPVEIRIFPNNRELPFQHYFTLGASFNFSVYSENEINFANKSMEIHNDLVHSQLASNNIFSSFLYGAIGFKIGKTKEGRFIPWGNIDFVFPYFMLSDKTFSFVTSYDDSPLSFGMGIQLSLQIPIGKNVPMGSKTN